MKRPSTKVDIRAIAQRAHGAIETALWGGLGAFVIYFALFVAPKIPEYRAIQEAARLHAIAAEQEFYCEKWGKHAGTREHALCVLDLQEFHANIVRRFVEENSF